MATIGSDNFNRTSASGLGTASDGQTWSVLTGSVSFSVSPSEGTGTGATNITDTALGTTTPTDTDQAIRFKETSYIDQFGLVTRQNQAAGNRYRLSVSAGNTLNLVKTVSSVSTTLGTATISYTANTFYWLRLQVIGTTLQGKFWVDGSAEPSTWNIASITDSSLTSGEYGFYVKLNNVADTVTFDSYVVTDGTTSPTSTNYTTNITEQLTSFDATASLSGNQSITEQLTSFDATIAGSGNQGITEQLTSAYAESSVQANGNVAIIEQLTTFAADATTQAANTVPITEQLTSFAADATIAGSGTITIVEQLLSFDAIPSLQGNQGITEQLTSAYAEATATPSTPPTPAQLSVSPTSLNFSGHVGGSVGNQNAVLSNIGGSSGNWTSSFSYISGSGWLSFTPASGTLGSGANQTIAFSVSLTGLAIGSYLATVTFTCGSSVVSVSVSLTVSAVPVVRSVAIAIGGNGVGWMEGSLKLGFTLDQRSTCTFMVYDASGTNHYQPGQTVIVTDSITGILFTGYVDDSQEKNMFPNAAIISTITCIDQHYLADKRVAQKDYLNRYAGDISSDLLHTYLAPEGVNLSNSANRSDQYQVDWGQGTLTGLVAASNVSDVQGGGNLELSPSGSAASYAQQTSSDFSGSANLLAYNSSLQGVTFTPTQSMKLTGTQGGGNSGNMYTYVKFWAGSYVIPSSYPVLVYDIWIPDSCPQQMAGIDLVFTDGTTFRDTPVYPQAGGLGVYPDSQGVGAHPNNDLSGLATNQWYNRQLGLYGPTTTLAGKTLAYATFAFEGDTGGNYTAYVRNVYIQYWNGSSFVVGQTLFSTTATATPNTPQQLQTSGYSNVNLSVVTTYEVSGTMLSTTFDTSSAGIYNTSLLQWQETDATNCTVAVNFSADAGVTYSACTNNAPLPGLLAGQNLSGIHGIFQYVFVNTGNDPTQTPILTSVQTVVNPSYACTKSDIQKIYQSASSWTSGGSLTNLTASGNTLALNGYTKNWNIGDLSSQTLYGSNGPGQYSVRKQLQLRLNNGTPNFAISRFDFAGQWKDFTAEIDVNVSTAGDEYGLVYRTTGWQNTNDTYAYSAYVSTTQIVLGKGTNVSSGSGLFTSISSVSITLSSGSIHRLKLVVNGSTHQVYLDNVLYINVTDSTYTGSGYIGARIYSPTSNYDTGNFDNFGVVASLSGQWVSNAFNLSSLGTSSNSQLTTLLDPSVNTSLCTLLVEISYNNGSSWYNTSPVGYSYIPGLGPNTNVSSYTQVKLRVTLSTSTATALCILDGMTLLVLGKYQSTGTRIAPPASMSGISQLGSSAITWNGLVPAPCSCTIDSSTDGVTFTNVATVANATPGNASIAGINGQSDPVQDSFSSNSSSNYTQTAKNGGTAATWNWDTANTRLIGTSGISAILLYQGVIAQNVDVLCTCDWGDNAGLVWCFADTSDFYELIINDNSYGTGSGLYLNKVKTNTVTTLHSQTGINFVRGIPHLFEVTMQIQSGGGALITVIMDGSTMFTYTDTTPLAGGQVGLFAGNKAEYYQFLFQQLGDLISLSNAYTRVTMTTYDPTVTPQLTTLTLAAHAPNIGKGNLIPQTNQYDVNKGGTKSIAGCLDDLAKQSNYYWQIDKNKNFTFNHRASTRAPRIVTNNEMLVGTVTVQNINTSYRNSQWVNGSINLVSESQSFVGDGKRKTFSVTYPVHQQPTITVNGAYYTVGIAGVDTGKAFYWQAQSRTITHDTSLFPLLSKQTLTVNYVAEIPDVVNQQSSSEISARAALDVTSGIVEAAESAPNLVVGGATTLANARLGEYATKGQVFNYTTNQDGLQVGMQATHFIAQHNVQGVPAIIRQIDLTYKTVMQSGVATLLPYYKTQAVSGALLYDWTHFFAIMGQQ